MRPGYKTTEFWITLTGQIIALCVILRLVNPADAEHLQTTISSAIAGAFAVVTSAVTIVHYIGSRTALKHRLFDQTQESGRGAPPNNSGSVPGPLTGAAILFAFLLLSGLANAQAPQRTALLPWRQRVEDFMRQYQAGPRNDNEALLQVLRQLAEQQQQIIALLQRQNAPPQPQIIILGPHQQIPLGGPPLQQIPLGGPPRQDIPLGGPPRQDIPLGGPPHQDIPLGPAPRQEIPIGPAQPKQQIPPGEVKPAPTAPPAMPRVPLRYERYTRQKSPAR
jgi:hypothetical protein